MSGISDYLSNKLLDHTLGNTAYTQPATLYLALFLTGGVEVSGGSYARQVIEFGSASSGQALNSNIPIFTMPSCTITDFAIYDALTSGNELFSKTLPTSIPFTSLDTYSHAAGSISISSVPA